MNITDPVYSLDPGVNDPRIYAAAGWYMTLACLVGALVSLSSFALDSAGFRVLHDERTRDGGALAPSYLRFRIARERTGSNTQAR